MHCITASYYSFFFALHCLLFTFFFYFIPSTDFAILFIFKQILYIANTNLKFIVLKWPITLLNKCIKKKIKQRTNEQKNSNQNSEYNCNRMRKRETTTKHIHTSILVRKAFLFFSILAYFKHENGIYVCRLWSGIESKSLVFFFFHRVRERTSERKPILNGKWSLFYVNNTFYWDIQKATEDREEESNTQKRSRYMKKFTKFKIHKESIKNYDWKFFLRGFNFVFLFFLCWCITSCFK